MQKITTFLWFDGKAEEAAKFYVSVFRNSKVLGMNPGPDGKPMLVRFELEGQEFMALNGGPKFSFTPAISLSVDCQSQQEVDELWDKLTAGGGRSERCGWLKDKFGLSWQIVPQDWDAIFSTDPDRAARVFGAMMTMKKLDIAALEAAGDA
jgi:predicted 3-demethylubiquinone-9 3-methyltransferase (glyoxalase superfamily)